MSIHKIKSVFITLFIVSIFIAISAHYNVTVADGYAGLIPSKKKTTTRQEPKKQGGVFSFIKPLFNKDKKQQQQKATTPTQPQDPAQQQGYKSYESYDSYYKEQEQKAKSQPFVPQTNIKQKPQTPIGIVPQKKTPQTDIVPPAKSNMFVTTAEEKNTLAQINLRGPEGLPKTALIKRKVIAAIEKLENPNLSKSKKREALQEDIKLLNSYKAGLLMEVKHGDAIYQKMQLPKNYTDQVKEDNAGALALIQQALEKLNKY